MSTASPTVAIKDQTHRLSRVYVIVGAVALLLIDLLAAILYGRLAADHLITEIEAEHLSLGLELWQEARTPGLSLVRLAHSGSIDVAQQSDHSTRLHAAVLETIEGTDTLKVRLYDEDGLVVYSTDPDEVGEHEVDVTEWPGWNMAVASDLQRYATFAAVDGEVANRQIVSTRLSTDVEYRYYSGEPILAFYTDVTPQVQKIRVIQWGVFGGIALILVLALGWALVSRRRAV